MKNLKIFAVAMMLLTAGTPVMADNEKDGDNKEQQCEEIDNYDFLYNNENYDEDFEFEPINDVLDEAFSHMGARYRSGQAGPNAFDCAQFNQGDPVDKDKLQIGDLVFFTSPRSGRSIGHVGIVVDVDPISGSFNFIHASTKGVKVSNSNERYYSRRYVGARRVM